MTDANIVVPCLITIICLLIVILGVVTADLVFAVTRKSNFEIFATGPTGASFTGPTGLMGGGSTNVATGSLIGVGQLYASGSVFVAPFDNIAFTATGPITGSISNSSPESPGLIINTGGIFQYNFTVLASNASQNFIEVRVGGLPVGVSNSWASVTGPIGTLFSVVGNGIFQLGAADIPTTMQLINNLPEEIFLGPTGINASLSVYQLSL
jgi:hypothetical protein